MKVVTLLSCALFLMTGSLHARSAAPLFVENRGQWPDEVRYRLQCQGLTLWITDRGAVYDLFEKREAGPPALLAAGLNGEVSSFGRSGSSPDRMIGIRGHVVRQEFIGASSVVETVGVDEASGSVNYLLGDDPKRWGRGCRTFSSIRLNNLYDGVDALFRLDGGSPRYDLMIAPNADPTQVRMRMVGADGVRVLRNGRLEMITSRGTVEMRDLLVYQSNERGERCQIDARFVVTEEGIVTFDIGRYDRSKPLVVDPLVYSTFIGDSGYDFAYLSGPLMRLAVDAEGSAYVAASSFAGADYPLSVGAYDNVHGGVSDIAVTKMSRDGTAVEYSTYIGGRSSDTPYGLALDEEGNVYLTGVTQSGGVPDQHYPTTPGVFSDANVHSIGVFVTKLNASGTDLIFSTLIGAQGSNAGHGIALDADRNVYITGYAVVGASGGTPYPTTQGAYSDTNREGGDAFVTKLNSVGTELIYSTFIGGSEPDVGRAITVDALGYAYVTGTTGVSTTTANDFPITPGTYRTTERRREDVFLTKLNREGTALEYSTYFGGVGYDAPRDIARDADGFIYLVGTTSDQGKPIYPTTPGAYDTSIQGSGDVFVTKLSPDGTTLIFSTVIGGDDGEFIFGMDLNASRQVCIVGHVKHSSSQAELFPTTSDAISREDPGRSDAFLAVLDAGGSELVYSTLLGGSQDDAAFDVVVDGAGDYYLVGAATNTGRPADDFPTTEGAYRETHVWEYDIYLAKISVASSAAPTAGPLPTMSLDLH